MELFFNIIQVIFGFLCNNWICFLASIIFLIYNMYKKIKNKHKLSMIIDNMKENFSIINNIGFIYKIKFVLYIFSMIGTISITLFYIFDDNEEFATPFYKMFEDD